MARLPDRGVLLFATDIQGNLRDYERMKALYAEEEERGNQPVLVFCGDLVHGPDEATVASWPDFLGTPYEDRSAEILLDFERFSREARAFSLLGNHEHAHVGGPVVSKFHPDEGAVLEASLREHAARMRDLMSAFPLVAVAPCGAVLTHGAPRGAEADLEAFERLSYEGFESVATADMYRAGTVGALLWARSASPDHARSFLASTALESGPGAFVAYGHDVVREGYEKIGAEQICLSTSFGLHDQDKVYLRLDLSRRYTSVDDLRDGEEIRPLY